MAVTPLPTPPSRQDPANFSARADAFLAALPTFATELNALSAGESAAGLASALALDSGAGLVGVDLSESYAAGSVGDFLLNQPRLNLKNVPYPSSAPTVAVGSAGALTGTYYWQVAFRTADGNTEASVPSAGLVLSAQRANLTAIPVSADPSVIARDIYRTPAGAVDSILARYVGTISDNTTTTFVDNVADGSLGAAVPKSNGTGASIRLNGAVIGRVGPYTTTFGANAHPSTTGYANTAFGSNAMRMATTGYRNTAFGIDALEFLTTGARNTAGGVHALGSLTTGNDSTGFGYGALQNATGQFNTATGSLALSDNTTGTNNTAAGAFSLQQNLTGQSMTATGSNALRALTGGTGNTASGAFCSYNLLTGDFNTLEGFQTGYNQTGGSTNTGFGTQALFSNVSGAGNVALGAFAGYYETGSNHLWIDNQTRTDLADAKVKALIYGEFAGTVADQKLTVNGLLNAAAGTALPPTSRKTGAYTQLATDSVIHVQGAASVPLTLLAGAAHVGRIVTVCNYAAFTVVSASSNVVPQGQTTAGTAILAATAGKWCDLQLQADGTTWQVIRSN